MTKKQPASPARVATILYCIAAVIAIGGLCDAIYLTVAHLTGESVACGPSAGCSEVLSSKYSHIGNVPTASFGAVAYFAVFSCATLAAFGYPFGRRFFAYMVWTMFAVTLYLLFLQAFVLHAYCRFCLLSAALVFLLAAIAIMIPRQPIATE